MPPVSTNVDVCTQLPGKQDAQPLLHDLKLRIVIRLRKHEQDCCTEAMGGMELKVRGTKISPRRMRRTGACREGLPDDSGQ